MKQYSHIFNVNITVIMQDRSTLQNQTFTFSPDHGWATPLGQKVKILLSD
ncbi:hypothetical protein FOPG_18728 [Fusarium oxysporum f. sp. conglutinans race 2 54008]|uniref:Uncharacterized protein n=1 Tax=Fusarium oxysporum f. sp. conglutinans race 2 54008 TaxID=1089457 RepID=X0HV26_FUSOX|nr:hypothetical protein FOPG_18728 [Fusarium oxysporum f. sp. conglutinans race 2 54008]